jgi:hypothetical protein
VPIRTKQAGQNQAGIRRFSAGSRISRRVVTTIELLKKSLTFVAAFVRQ